MLNSILLTMKPNLLKNLSDILRNPQQSEITRAQAAIQLKNAIYSKDETIKLQHQERWLQIPEDVRTYIKNNCIETLGTETKRPSQAAQCVGHIACAELPRNLWPDCINRLMINVTDTNATEMLKESSLETIGYICLDIVRGPFCPYSGRACFYTKFAPVLFFFVRLFYGILNCKK